MRVPPSRIHCVFVPHYICLCISDISNVAIIWGVSLCNSSSELTTFALHIGECSLGTPYKFLLFYLSQPKSLYNSWGTISERNAYSRTSVHCIVIIVHVRETNSWRPCEKPNFIYHMLAEIEVTNRFPKATLIRNNFIFVEKCLLCVFIVVWNNELIGAKNKKV